LPFVFPNTLYPLSSVTFEKKKPKVKEKVKKDIKCHIICR